MERCLSGTFEDVSSLLRKGAGVNTIDEVCSHLCVVACRVLCCVLCVVCVVCVECVAVCSEHDGLFLFSQIRLPRLKLAHSQNGWASLHKVALRNVDGDLCCKIANLLIESSAKVNWKNNVMPVVRCQSLATKSAQVSHKLLSCRNSSAILHFTLRPRRTKLKWGDS